MQDDRSLQDIGTIKLYVTFDSYILHCNIYVTVISLINYYLSVNPVMKQKKALPLQ
jgi:hypothetical protein